MPQFEFHPPRIGMVYNFSCLYFVSVKIMTLLKILLIISIKFLNVTTVTTHEKLFYRLLTHWRWIRHGDFRDERIIERHKQVNVLMGYQKTYCINIKREHACAPLIAENRNINCTSIQFYHARLPFNTDIPYRFLYICIFANVSIPLRFIPNLNWRSIPHKLSINHCFRIYLTY